MKLHTASETINFAEKLENESAKVYERLSQKSSTNKDVFLALAKENGKYIQQIKRAYYEVISDAIEGGFAFDLEGDEYTMTAAMAEKGSYHDVLDAAVRMEETIMKFYLEAAKQSESLMADVPRTFLMVAKKRGDRIAKLRSLLCEERGLVH